MASHGRLEELHDEECRRLLATASLGRVGVSIGALPAILPVNFVVDGERVVFRTVPGTKLDAATAQAVVAFEADGSDPATGQSWSVLVRGIASEITEPADLARARSLPLEAWGLADAADRYVQIGTELVTGRRLVRNHEGASLVADAG